MSGFKMEKDINMGKIIKSGEVEVKTPFQIQWFDEDDGWVKQTIKPGLYEYRVLNVRGWKPRQLKINGEWMDVADTCKELEMLLSEVEETTTVANIAPTVDYVGHIKPIVNIDSYESEYDNPDDVKKRKDDEDEKDSWVSPIGRIIAGESVRKVIGEVSGIFEEKTDNIDLFTKINKVKDIMNYPGKLVVVTAYPHKSTFGMRIEDPDITKKYKNKLKAPGVIVDIKLDTTLNTWGDKMDRLDIDFNTFVKNPVGFREYLNNLTKDPEIKMIHVYQR